MEVASDSFGPLMWRCHICKKMRLDKMISVAVHDCSADVDAPKGTMIANVRYCNDNPDCKAKAESREYPHHGCYPDSKLKK